VSVKTVIGFRNWNHKNIAKRHPSSPILLFAGVGRAYPRRNDFASRDDRVRNRDYTVDEFVHSLETEGGWVSVPRRFEKN